MKVCGKCKEKEPEYTIDGWIIDDENKWEYEVCKDCYKQLKKLIDKWKPVSAKERE